MSTRQRTLALHAFGRKGIVRLPGPRTGALLATGMLATGVLLGVAFGPGGLGSGAANAAQQVIEVAGGQPAAQGSAGESTEASSSADTGADGPDSSSAQGGSGEASAAGASATAGSASAAGNTGVGNTGVGDTGVGNTGVGNSGAGGTGSPTTPTTTTPTTTVPQKLNLTGVVVSLDAAAQSFDVVDRKGALHEVHSTSTPKPGTKLELATRQLANGTLLAGRQVTQSASAQTKVTARGVVSFVDATAKRYALSARGVSLIVAAPTVPSVGDRLEVALSLPASGAVGAAATLSELHRKERGRARPPLELAGLISTVDESRRTVTISADGAGLSSDTITISVPALIALKKLTPAETVVAHVTVGSGDSYTLTGAAPDLDATAADSLKDAVGDFQAKRSEHGTRRAG